MKKILGDITEKNINKMEVVDNIKEINNIDYKKKEKVLQVADFPKISHTNSDMCSVEDRGLKISEFVISNDELKTLLKREKYYVQPL